MKKIILTTLTIISFVGLVDNAHATISSISVSPSSRNVSANTPAVLSATWTPIRAGGVGPTTVNSSSIVVRLGDSNGPILLTIAKSVSKTQTVVNNFTPYIFSEAITIPRDVVYRATKAGQPLVVQRVFTDQSDAGVNTGEMLVNVSGGMSADFNVSRVTLTFEDGSSSCISNSGKSHTALANIVASGTGILRGAWQVRTGGGLGSFRTLRTVNVPASGNTVIQSPVLPKVNQGERLEVRLAIESPVTNFDVPSISCGGTGSNSLFQYKNKDQKLAKLISPQANTPLNADSDIKWEGVKGAKSYRIEILADENGEPITAQLVKPGSTSAKLSPLTLDKLRTNGRYTVRVVAE